MIRAWFNSLSARESVLLVAFIWMILLVWLFYLVSDLRENGNRLQIAGRTLEVHDLRFQQEVIIDAALEEALAGLDSAQTFSAPQLLGRLDALARQNQLTFDTNSPFTQQGDIFSIHTARIVIKRAEISELIPFTQKLQEHAPYLGLRAFQIVATKRDPRYLDATFEVSSFELNADAL